LLTIPDAHPTSVSQLAELPEFAPICSTLHAPAAPFISSDTLRIVSAGSGDDTNLIKVWNATSGTLDFTLSGHADFVTALAAFRDGLRIASGGSDGIVTVWTIPVSFVTAPAVVLPAAAPGQLTVPSRVLRGHIAKVTCLAELDNDRLASSSADTTIRIWDLTMAEDVYCWTRVYYSNQNWVTDFLSVLGDGETLVSTQRDFQMMAMWDTACDLKKPPAIGIHNLFDAQHNTVGLSVLADGVTIACGDAAKGISLWKYQL
jgi:WD40 repeat protein